MLSARYLRRFRLQSLSEGSNIIPGDVLGPIQENISQAGKEILKAGEDIKKEVKGATEGLKGLFKKKKD